MDTLQNQHVLILGLGASGLAMARWCVRVGAVVTVVDTRPAPPQLDTLRAELPQVNFRSGPMDASLIEGTDIRALFKSPGIAPAQAQGVLDSARARGLWVGAELDLFGQALNALKAEHNYLPTVLAVTGTNGKTTVTALTGHLLRWAGKTVAVAGNIGPTLLDSLQSALERSALPQVWVLELSSFQLCDTRDFHADAATVLNVTQDHLDWHGTMASYAAAKARIFGSRGLMVLNRDDATVLSMLPAGAKTRDARTWVSFGAGMPTRPGDFGLEDVHGMVWLVRAMEADETRRKRKDEPQETYIQRLMPADALRIRGRHNATNAMAALALTTAAGCALGPVLFALREYRGEPHRVEPVGIVQGVEFMDDSKGTNVGATVAALQGLGQAPGGKRADSPTKRLVVILGGEGKGQDFTPLADPVARYVRCAVLMGRDAPHIRAALEGTGVQMLDAPSLPQAVVLASQRAHPGDTVLLSPACASFDMFENYVQRAEVFRGAVRELALSSGVALEAGE